MNKMYWALGLLSLVIIVTFFLGPVPPDPVYVGRLPELPGDLTALAEWVADREAKLPLREDNGARIVFQDSTPKVTEYSIVYLHGFAGSYRDGYPVNVAIADTFGANLYLARYADHGLRPPASLDGFTADAAWESAVEALAIGGRIGRKVIIMSTSTGGTLAIKLAAEFPESVHAIVNMSPNIEDDVPFTFLLNSPWGYELAGLVSLGSHRKVTHEEPIAYQYWDTLFPSHALVNLQVLVSTTMVAETYRRVRCPVLTLYYYKNAFEEDERVEVSVYPEVHEQFATPAERRKLVALDTPGTHFIGSDIKSKDTGIVEDRIVGFCREVLGMKTNPQ